MQKIDNTKGHSRSADVFGQVLRDFYQGKGTDNIIERDDGYVDCSTTRNYFTGYKEWSSIEKAAIKFAKGRVLDVGCGAGRHSLYLQKKGLEVYGIDNSPLAIKVCKSRGLKHAIVLPFENAGELRPLVFDSVLMFGNNFGLFRSFKNARKMLLILHTLTTSDALIIAIAADPYKTELQEHLEYHKLNRKRGRMGGQARIRIRYKNLIGSWFDYLFVSQSELKQILDGTGWNVKRFFERKSEPLYGIVLEKA